MSAEPRSRATHMNEGSSAPFGLWPQSPALTIQPARDGWSLCLKHSEFLQSPHARTYAHTHAHSWLTTGVKEHDLYSGYSETTLASRPPRGLPGRVPQQSHGRGLASPQTPENSSTPLLQVREERLIKTFKSEAITLQCQDLQYTRNRILLN